MIQCSAAPRADFRLRARTALALCTLIGVVALFPQATPRAAGQATPSGTSYYVDCNNGSDGNSGTAPSQAWRSVEKVNRTWLSAGDSVRFQRGCAWSGPLNVGWSGTTTAPVVVGAYGAGELPVIQSGTTQVDAVFVTGSHVVLDSLWARGIAPQRDAGCDNAAVGQISGFRFAGPAAYNTVQNSRATDLTDGVKIERTSHHNTIVRNTLTNNRMMAQLTREAGDDYGAFAVNVHGDDNEVAYNDLSGSDACSYDYTRDGAAVEIYGGQRNSVHHNRSTNNDTFAELGDPRSADNRFAYNVVTAAQTKASFLVTRGAADSFGPVARTRAYNNTVYLSGSNATAVVCVGGCSPEVLTLKNSIIWSEHQVAWTDQPFDEGYNVYWKSNGAPLFKNTGISTTSKRADPLFVSSLPTAFDFHLRAASPAVDAGTMDAGRADYTVDADGVAVPSGPAVDAGAYERAGTAPPPTATAPPTSTPALTATAVPPSSTPSPSSTVSPSSTPSPSATSAPPSSTATPVTSATAIPPTDTSVPATPTRAPATPAAPRSLDARPRPGAIRLTWIASTTPGVTYSVYRSTAPGVEQLYRTDVTGTRFDDSGASSGRTYYYRLTSKTATGESARSNQTSARAR